MLEILTILWTMFAAIVVAFLTLQFQASIGSSWHAAYLVAINLVALGLYVYDKIGAKIQSLPLLGLLPIWRVPTPVMTWGVAFFGGIIGAGVGMALAEHKTGKGEGGFRSELFMAAIAGAAALFLLYQASRRWGIFSLAEIDAFIANGSQTLVALGQTLLAFALGFVGQVV